jgi:hypothetical protein
MLFSLLDRRSIVIWKLYSKASGYHTYSWHIYLHIKKIKIQYMIERGCLSASFSNAESPCHHDYKCKPNTKS